MSEIGTIYIFHLSKPFKHARHYTGWTRNLKYRWQHHINGTGSNFLKHAMAAGSEPILVKTIVGDRNLERKIKNHRNPRRHCPICKKRNEMGEYLSVKRTTESRKNLTKPECKWCGNREKKRFYFYDGQGPFCNSECCESYNGSWPSSFFGRLPVEYVND